MVPVPKDQTFPGFFAIPLEEHLNVAGCATAAHPVVGKLDGQFGFAGEALPAPGLAPIQGIPFLIPARGEGRCDFMIPEGQKLPAPRGAYRTLYLVGTSVMGSSGMELLLEYEGGERAAEILRFTDWCHAPQFKEIEAVRAGHRYSEAGPEEPANRLWLQVLLLPPERRLSRLVFGSSPNLRLLAVTLGREEYILPPPARLAYLLSRLGRRNEEASRYRARYESLEDIAALCGDEALLHGLKEQQQAILEGLGTKDLFLYDGEKISRLFRAMQGAVDELEATARRRLRDHEAGSSLSVTLVGHSHLDAVWLWPWNITVEKAFRTFSRNLERLKDYPGTVFAQSCPLFYDWMETYHPELFDALKRAVEEGRWELVGGMWVESDGNLPTGEALVRQRLFGQRYYLEKFGRLSEVAWIPDTFGMHDNHPQILRKTGGRYFFTTKLAWNYENVFPFHHFIWESPDGSRVLALQNPIGCGAGPGPHPWLEEAVRKHNPLLKPGEEGIASAASPTIPAEKLSGDFVPDVLAIFGEGDGGEGPSEPMFQRAETLAMLKGYQHGKVHDHFRKVEERYGSRLPVWKDELYLENHRGTTTSQGRIKALNRQGEAALLKAEKWSTLACALLGRPSRKRELDKAWKKLLFNQFHDILPGTSVGQAYVDAELDFEELFRATRSVEEEALASLCARISTLPKKPGSPLPTGRALVLFNPLSFDREETVRVPWGFPHVKVFDRDQQELPSQVIYRDGKHWLFFHLRVPALGYTQVRLLAGKRASSVTGGATIEGLTAENRFYRVTLNDEGDLQEIFDKTLGRNLLKGPGNRIRFYQNRPREWSNWNLDPDYEKHELPLEGPASIEILDQGPVVAAFRVTRAAPGGAPMVREIRLYGDEKRIDFSVDLPVTYGESLVKAVFPFDVDADRVITETAYGTYSRPTHPGNAFERAKWEVWTQKWLDLVGPDSHVTMVNTAKHGFDVRGDRIGLTLVKGGIMPDPFTDQYTHRIDYALLSGEKGAKGHKAWQKGHAYNFPVQGRLEAAHEGPLPGESSFVSLTPDHLCLEVIKEGEDAPGFVVRLFEVEGLNAQNACLRLPFEVARAETVDFLELTADERLETAGRNVFFSMGHHEIKAIRVIPLNAKGTPQ